jgi:tetratricopeptide (TPR) repeat protein
VSGSVEELLGRADQLDREGAAVAELLDIHDRVLAIDPGNERALHDSAILLAANGEHDRALARLDEWIALDPNDAGRHAAKADLLVAQGNFEQATKEYRLALDDTDQLTERADLLTRLGFCYSYVGERGLAVETIDAALTYAPDDPAAWMLRGDLLMDGDDIDGAFKSFETAARLDPSAFSVADWNVRARRLYDINRNDDAIKLYRQANYIEPNATSWHGIGISLTANGELDAAVDALKHALELEPDDATLHNELGVTLSMMHEDAEAVASFARAAELDPSEVLMHMNLGYAHSALRQDAAAERAFRTAAELDSNNADAWIGLGMCELESGRNDEALASFLRATEADDLSSWAWNNASYVLFRLGRYDEALAFADRAVEIDPDNLSALSNRMNVLLALGRTDEAEAISHRDAQLRSELLSEHLFDHEGALAALEPEWETHRDKREVAASIIELLLKVGRFADARELAADWLENVVANDYPDPCVVRFFAYAACVADSQVSNGRHEAFDAFVECFRQFDRYPLWPFTGLRHALAQMNLPSETAFTLSLGIDLLTRRVERDMLSFFEQPDATTVAHTASAGPTSNE